MPRATCSRADTAPAVNVELHSRRYILLKGTHRHQPPSAPPGVGAMAASQDWHFRVRNFTSQEFSYPSEATCDEDADYGYIFSTVDDQGYNLSPEDTLGPVAIPAIDPTVRPTWQPNRPHHRSRSQAPGCDRSRGTNHPTAATSLASPSTGNGRANQIRPTYASTGPPRPASSSPATGTRTSRPTKPPATRTSTSTRCTRSTLPSHGTDQLPGAATTTSPTICSRRPR